MHVQRAHSEDLEQIISLLKQEKLPVSGVSDVIDSFSVVKSGNTVLAAGVIEPHGADGLLRSVVVASDQQGKGLGARVVSHLVDHFEGDVYLLTETAERFFVRFGFETVSRDVAPAELRAAEEFRSLCPESAAFMRRSVEATQGKPYSS